MKNFNSFLVEADEATTQSQQPQRVSEDVVTTFGRHNPPHLGHKLTLDYANDVAGNIGETAQADQRFYTSKSQDPKKNPLPYEVKVDHLKRMFPEHSKKWDTDDRIRTVLGVASKAYDDGYKNFHFIGGGDRKQGMEDLLRRYNETFITSITFIHTLPVRETKREQVMIPLPCCLLPNKERQHRTMTSMGSLKV